MVLVVGYGYLPGTNKFHVDAIANLYVQRGNSYRLVPGEHRLTKRERANLFTSPFLKGTLAKRASIFGNCAVAVALP